LTIGDLAVWLFSVSKLRQSPLCFIVPVGECARPVESPKGCAKRNSIGIAVSVEGFEETLVGLLHFPLKLIGNKKDSALFQSVRYGMGRDDLKINRQ